MEIIPENPTLEQVVHAAIALHQSGDLAAAQRHYEAILTYYPDDANVLMNLSSLLRSQGEKARAAELLQRLMTAHPALAYPHFGYGNLLMEQERYAEAVPAFEQNLLLAPDHANAHWNLALCHLLQGDYARGLPHFEWRFDSDHLKTHRRNFAAPLWLGHEPLTGKTLLIHPEQGFGDYLQSVRYFPLLAALGATLYIEVPPALLRLMRASFPALTFTPFGAALPITDFHCPIMSLPLALGITLETVPQQMPYLGVPAELSQHWQRRLGTKTRPRIGLVWSGQQTHKNDAERSIPLHLFDPLRTLPFDFYSLQKEVRDEDKSALGALLFYGEALQDFADTAALLQQMDLLITVDTAVAHLAGALGLPVWLLLPQPPDYRWLLSRIDSPLYPSMRFVSSALLLKRLAKCYRNGYRSINDHDMG